MCGIVGYIGYKEPASVVLSGLKRLEYRGYDSAGIALLDKSDAPLVAVKRPGKVAELETGLTEYIAAHPRVNGSSLAIGHTRWATHGAPTEPNAHPHLSPNEKFAVVHNGIIDNYLSIKERLLA